MTRISRQDLWFRSTSGFIDCPFRNGIRTIQAVDRAGKFTKELEPSRFDDPWYYELRIDRKVNGIGKQQSFGVIRPSKQSEEL